LECAQDRRAVDERWRTRIAGVCISTKTLFASCEQVNFGVNIDGVVGILRFLFSLSSTTLLQMAPLRLADFTARLKSLKNAAKPLGLSVTDGLAVLDKLAPILVRSSRHPSNSNSPTHLSE
jgi:hypothetical protein